MLIGYARVSTRDQSLNLQLDALQKAGCDKIFTDIASGAKSERPGLEEALAYVRKGDVLVAISASGNSPNLLKALEYARECGIKTVALTAFDGGRMKAVADEGVHVPTDLKEYGPAEDGHMFLDHLVSAYLSRIIRAT